MRLQFAGMENIKFFQSIDDKDDVMIKIKCF